MKLSICMMVKNETKYLDNCLKSLQPLRDAVDSELIIIDTGSEDDTVEIAKRYADKLYFHEWNHDFSGMRNKTISYATGEWIFIIDADEVLQEAQPIVDFLQAPTRKKIGAVAITGKSITDENNLAEYAVMLTMRLFRNDGYFHYDGVVHNQPIFKGDLIEVSASLLHYGYVSNDKELMEKKFARTSSLLKNELEKDPENIYYWFQLSVTYGMHDELDKAIEYIEKAYQLFVKQGKPKDSMYVMTHFAHINQLSRNYKKVEEVCLEALQIKVGYLDIYYYLAEAQAVLKKYQDSIDNYIKYLDVLKKREHTNEKDTAVTDYTLGNLETVHYNLSIICRKVDNYEMALHYAKKVKQKDSIKQNLKNISNLFIRLGQYNELRNYYNTVVEKDSYVLFYEKLEEAKSEFDNGVKLAVAKVFSDVDGHYGLLSRMVLDCQSGKFSNKTLEEIEVLDFSQIPRYCSDILYYLLIMHYPLTKILTHFKEIWLYSLLDDLVKRYEDLSVVLYEYLQDYIPQCSSSEYKISKLLCRYVLALDKIGEGEYQEIFNRYVNDGISYMELTYNPCVFAEELVYEVKNDEEVFFVYMYQAKVNETIDKANYIKYLRQALEVLPMSKKGIEMLLARMQAADCQVENEMEAYKVQVKNTIKELMTNGQLDEAEILVADYISIVPMDMEVLALKSQLLVLKNCTKPES